MIFKKFYFSEFVVPKKILLLSLLLVSLLAYPVLLLTPFFPASADPTTTGSVAFLGDKIPQDYQPYSPLNFGYQIGFPLLVNAFSDIFTFLPVYLWSWLLSLVSGALQLFGVYFVAREFFKSEKAAEFASLLFFGTKLVYENFYVGEYAWLLATGLMLFTLYFAAKKSGMQYLLFPVILVLHPAIAFNALIFFAIAWLFYPGYFELPKIFASAVFALPAFFANYSPIIFNVLFGAGLSSWEPGRGLLYYAQLLPTWIGFAVFFVFAVSFAYLALQKFSFTREQKMFGVLFASGTLLYLLFGFFGVMLAGKAVELALLGVLFLAASFLEKIRLPDTSRFKLALLVFCLVFFFTSSILTHYRGGSKITLEEATFAADFREFDPELSRTLFLAPYSYKIAEFSNKVPFDLTGHYLSDVKLLYYSQEEYARFKGLPKITQSIVDTLCDECIDGLDVKYVVVKNGYYGKTLDYPVAFSTRGFVVYRKT
ncbi:MAG: hypothetical protein AABW99_02230 [archaeon]